MIGLLNTKSDFVDYDLKKIFIDIPRDELLKKISKRTELMFKQKCINEVKKFNLIKLNKSLSANKLIGVQEINSYLKGDILILNNAKNLLILRQDSTQRDKILGLVVT